MFHRHFIGRTVQIGACAAALLLYGSPAVAAPTNGDLAKGKVDKGSCKAAYKAAQEREQTCHLREAKELYLTCSKVACGAFMRPECTTKYTQLESDVPSVIPVVTDERGAAIVDVQVKMDGELLTSRLDGRALPVDPGMHEFTFTTGAGVIASQKVMIVAGQRNSPLSVSLGRPTRTLAASVTVPPPRANLEPRAVAPEKPAPEKVATRKLVPEKTLPVEDVREAASTGPQHRRSPGPLPYIIGGAGVAAVGVGALLTLWGQKDNSAMGQCAPDCAPATVTHIKTMYTIADISFGAGAAALGAAAYLFATSGSSGKERPPARAVYSVDVEPTRNGAFASVSGKF
jgi:hypothetical protein